MAKKSVTNRSMKSNENNKAEALSKVRNMASEFLDKLFTMSDASGIGYEEIMAAAQDTLEGVNIPEEESEEIRKRAKKERKTFVQVVLELVELGLAVRPSHIKQFRDYSELTGVPLHDVLDECLGEYIECSIETRLEDFADQTAQS